MIPTGPRDTEDDAKCGWGDPTEWSLPSTLNAQIPQRIWFERAVFRETEAPPSCYGRLASEADFAWIGFIEQRQPAQVAAQVFQEQRVAAAEVAIAGV